MAAATLPFTGLGLFYVCLLGAGLLLAGFTLVQVGTRAARRRR